tara:strand:+ start:2746 stop:3711 length:966 start_codon:yes stop_codon:yes gene_type:complete
MKIIVTGAAGFIGMQSCLKLLKSKFTVLGIDNLNNYYDKNLKLNRIKILKKFKKFHFKKIDISQNGIFNIFKKFKPDFVLHLAAQAGVRHSISHPQDYTSSNLVGFANILECSKLNKIKHLIYASSSSVYGKSKKFPLSESQNDIKPISYYGATKLANEYMAYSYSHLFKLPTTGLRFFTVYGPWGRPDMALFLFTDAIKNKKKIKMFNKGNMVRDFTYIDDITISIDKLIKKIPKGKNSPPHRILNIGSNKPIDLKKYIYALEKELKIKSLKKRYPMQKGDVKHTHASVKKLSKIINFKPKTSISTGIKKFVNWYNEYYV